MRNTKDGVNNTEQEPSCDDTLLEFRRTWRFLTGAGVLDHVFFMSSFDDNKIMFQV